MSGVTKNQRIDRSTPAGSPMLPWLNMAMPFSKTSIMTTATTGAPGMTMVANLISIDRTISSG